RILTIGIDPARNHLDLGLSDADILAMYRTMVLTRHLDDRTWALNRQGRAPFVVSAAGHEGTQIGAGYALDRSVDWVLPYYRDIGLVLSIGMTPEDVLLGVFSKATDPSSGGRQMPNHWSHPELRILSQGSVISTQYPQAAGIAYEVRRTGRPGVVLATGGEGSTSEGDFHEGLNIAGLKKLPVIFLIENNLYSISVPSDQQIAGDLTDRAIGYGIPAVSVDGNEVLDVYEAVKTAADRARAGGGPTFIEARTYRYYAHTSDDDDKQYRSPAEVEEWRRKDPIGILRQYLIESRLLDEAGEDAIDAEAAAAVAGAVERAAAAPDASDAFSMVYAAPIENLEPATRPDPVVAGEEINLVTAVNRALAEIMAAHPETTIFGEDVADPKGGVFRATVGLTDSFGPERSFNMPIAESSIIGVGIGMAAAGGKPIADIQFADFIHPAWNQIVSEAARLHYRSAGGWTCPMVIRTPYGGGIHGALYHSQSIEGFYAHVPGLKVVVPSTPADAKGLLWSAVEDPDPVLFLEPKKLYRLVKGPYPAGEYRVPIGKAALRRAGRDLTIIAYGTMAHFALEAAEQMAAQGIEAEVLDLRSIRPLDWASIEAAVRRTGKILIVHEDNEFAGFGAEVAAQIADKSFEWLDAPVRRYASPEVPAFPFAEALEAQIMPSIEGIVERAIDLAEF
ncbi:MAG: dehydrogenase E1 component subunit alpha/beta, partial [Acidimicrobiia bacterium]|nr:dehydrogenase E1 component subunit alpha/beta [Acidimicrobiia bacterium]